MMEGAKKHPIHRRRVTISDAEPPAMYRRPTSFQQDGAPKLFRRSSTGVDQPRDTSAPKYYRRSSAGVDPPQETTNFRKAQSFHMHNEPKLHQKSQSFHNTRHKSSDPISPDSSSSKPPLTKKSSSFHDRQRCSIVIKDELQASLFAFLDEQEEHEERSLSTVIQDWAYYENGKLRPLQMLLFEAPVLLPPNNPLVEHHEYFDKWKTLSRDSFLDEDGEDYADEVIQKVARRCKIFLHPDKWPSDLNEDQKFLLQSMWDTFQQSELF
jgi:hypothetical protein